MQQLPAFLSASEGTTFTAGKFYLRPLQPDTDVPLIHDWVNREYAVYWNLQNSTVEKVREMYDELIATPHLQPFMGFYEDRPAFLVEFYKAKEDRIGEYYDAQPGDYGFHLLMAPVEKRIPDFTFSVFRVIMDFLFSDPRVDRLIVEPDVRNEKIHVLNKRAGFEYQGQVVLPDKTAYLAFCTRR
jgi:RimJ/RimL family protein N-acetyltransferase